MKFYNKALPGNRYEVIICNAGKTFVLWDVTLRRKIATSEYGIELTKYAQKKNLINNKGRDFLKLFNRCVKGGNLTPLRKK